MHVSRSHRVAAAIIALGYIGVQAFQWHVFAVLPVAQGPAESLLLGPAPLNIARAISMLLSFLGLGYLFLVACAIAFPRRPLVAVAAFLLFFVFCLLEVLLRSVELLHVFIALPAQYQAAMTAGERLALLGQQALFGSIQHAVYLPLGFSFMSGSTLLVFALGERRIDRLAQCAFGLNALRLFLRQWDVYVFPPANFDALYDVLYLPLVVLTFAPIALWLLLRNEASAVVRPP